MIVKFTWEDKVSRTSELIYKNPKMFATKIPDFGEDIPPGEHKMIVEISLNG